MNYPLLTASCFETDPVEVCTPTPEEWEFSQASEGPLNSHLLRSINTSAFREAPQEYLANLSRDSANASEASFQLTHSKPHCSQADAWVKKMSYSFLERGPRVVDLGLRAK